MKPSNYQKLCFFSRGFLFQIRREDQIRSKKREALEYNYMDTYSHQYVIS